MSTILKCKMCGGDISVNVDMTVGTCQYCGTTMTLPRIDTDKKARLFNWANQLRLNNEFDKSYDAYKEIVSEDAEEAEAYWGMILSEYGVEYVEDPKTKKMVPTCHRTIQQSLKKSANYEMACKFADIESRFMYQHEADILEKIQKKILAISSKQEEYDAFICYKETDDLTGERTEDSVIAQQIYDELSKKGINTFFSRITLKDKLGEDYEPYIYAALKSAKVMVVVATSSDYFEAPWVKNEWSRYINFMSDDPGKKIIPVYKDITAYELPDELSLYQAQNFDKIGAIQDLVIGIESLLRDKDNTKKTMSEQDILSIVRDKEEREKKERKTKIKRATAFFLIIIILLITVFGIFKAFKYAYEEYFPNKETYETGVSYMNEKKYLNAANTFVTIKDFKDAGELRIECLYLYAEQLRNEGKTEAALKILTNISSYAEKEKISPELIQKIKTLKHEVKNQ